MLPYLGQYYKQSEEKTEPLSVLTSGIDIYLLSLNWLYLILPKYQKMKMTFYGIFKMIFANRKVLSNVWYMSIFITQTYSLTLLIRYA